MRLDAALLVLASALISAGVFLFSIPAGLICTGVLVAVLTVLYVYEAKVPHGVDR